MGRDEDIRHLEDLFGSDCCACLDKGRPRFSPHPSFRVNPEPVGSEQVIGYIEFDPSTGEITYGSYK